MACLVYNSTISRMKSAICWSKLNIIEESDQQRQKVTHVDCNDIQQNNPQIFSYQVPYLFQCSPLPCSYFYCLATNTFMNPRGQNILSFILNVFEAIQSVHDPDIESSFSKFVKYENQKLFCVFHPKRHSSAIPGAFAPWKSRAISHDSVSLPIRSVLRSS